MEPHLWGVNIGLGDGIMPLGNKPMLSKFYGICRDQRLMICHNFIFKKIFSMNQLEQSKIFAPFSPHHG